MAWYLVKDRYNFTPYIFLSTKQNTTSSLLVQHHHYILYGFLRTAFQVTFAILFHSVLTWVSSANTQRAEFIQDMHINKFSGVHTQYSEEKFHDSSMYHHDTQPVLTTSMFK
jgi:hypothetical protein